MKKLPLVFLLLFVFACEKDDDPAVDPETPPIKAEFKNYAEVKSDDWRTKIGQEITVEGYLIPVSENTYKIVADSSYAKLNTMLRDEDYILVQADPNAQDLNALQDLTGAPVKAVGKLAQFEPRNVQGESVMHTAELLGTKSLATITLSTLPADLRGKRLSISSKLLSDILSLQYIKPLPENRTKFALLYSGGINAMEAYPHYYNNIRIMYNLLLSQGYSRDNIVVVYKEGAPESIVPTILPPYFKYYPEIPVNQAATPGGLDNALAYLGDRMTGQNAELFVMLTNHGGGYHAVEKRNYAGKTDVDNDEPTSDIYRLDEVSTFYNTDHFITDDEFAAKINALPFVSLKALFLQCFSGGFIHDFKGRNRVLMSATTETEYSWGGGDSDMDIFLLNFITPLYAGAVQSPNLFDLDKNGTLSMYEIFLQARNLQRTDNKKYPQYSSSPQYDDDGDGVPNEPTANGFGAQLTL